MFCYYTCRRAAKYKECLKLKTKIQGTGMQLHTIATLFAIQSAGETDQAYFIQAILT